MKSGIKEGWSSVEYRRGNEKGGEVGVKEGGEGRIEYTVEGGRKGLEEEIRKVGVVGVIVVRGSRGDREGGNTEKKGK